MEVRYDPCRSEQLLCFYNNKFISTCVVKMENMRSVSYNLCRLYRSADIALIAGGNRKRWIIATENMQAGNVIKTSGAIGRMAGMSSSSTAALK